MTRPLMILGLALALAGCGGPRASEDVRSGPPGAPAPDNPDQELVDLDGCRWWVVRQEGRMVWQKMPGVSPECDADIAARQPPKEELAPPNDAEEGPEEAAAPDADDDTVDIADVEALTVQNDEEGGIGLYIQAATFRSASSAADIEASLRGEGYPVYSNAAAEEKSLYRIILGPFDSKPARITALRKLQRSGYPDAFLVVF